jgi:hypothetical protein
MPKHAGGRPPIWENPEDLQKQIDGYFADCRDRERLPCIAGLAYHCGVDRQTIYNYSEKDRFFGILKKARDYVLMKMEESMTHGEGAGGLIFLAKNYGYTDQRVVTHDVQGSLNKMLQAHFFGEPATDD